MFSGKVRLVQSATLMNKPSWWTDDRTDDWEHAKEAVRRDWEQTRHDLHLGGHELNQNLRHTLAQAVGSEALPAIDVANRPQVIATWQEAEVAIGFGYAARTYFGHQYPEWTSALGRTLEHEWKNQAMPWKAAEILVRHGYDVRH